MISEVVEMFFFSQVDLLFSITVHTRLEKLGKRARSSSIGLFRSAGSVTTGKQRGTRVEHLLCPCTGAAFKGGVAGLATNVSSAV